MKNVKEIKKYAIVIDCNREWAEKKAKMVGKTATAFAAKIVKSKKEAREYVAMFNNSYNQGKYAMFIRL